MRIGWNGLYTSDYGILVEAKNISVLPEPKIVIEEIHGRDGFYDFSDFNGERRVHYAPKEWEFRCGFEAPLKLSYAKRAEAVLKLFASYSGWIEVDGFPGVRWQGIITNKIDLAQVMARYTEFNLYVRTQPFAEDLTGVTVTQRIAGNIVLTVANPGTWYADTIITMSGTASGAAVGGVSIPYSGTLTNAVMEGPELTPGDNNIEVKGFAGTLEVAFVPRYLGGKE